MSERFEKAVEFATRAHEGQTRKYTDEPYITHPLAVAEIVRKVPSHTEDMLIAAVLHDTVEDTDVKFEDINREFGITVTRLVHYLTEVSRPEDGNRALRKKIDADHYASGPSESQTIKVADIIHNTRDISTQDPRFWVVYQKEMRYALSVLTLADPVLRIIAQKQIEG